MSILQARRYLPLTSSGGLAAAWTAYTPTVTSGTGTLTTISANSGRTLKIGRLVHYTVAGTITTNGTGATSIVFTLPYTAAAAGFHGSGLCTTSSKMLQAKVASGAATVVLTNYDGSYPAADGAVLQATGFFEATS